MVERWSGMPDCVADDIVVDIKCPFTLKSFCKLAECESAEDLKAQNGAKEYGYKYYWQIVSNAILTYANKGELVLFVPDSKQLKEIQENTSVKWISMANPSELPYFDDSKYYNNVTRIKFDIPQEDKDFLIKCVRNAVERLEEGI